MTIHASCSCYSADMQGTWWYAILSKKSNARRRDWMTRMFNKRKRVLPLSIFRGEGQMLKPAAHLFPNQQIWALLKQVPTGHLKKLWLLEKIKASLVWKDFLWAWSYSEESSNGDRLTSPNNPNVKFLHD